MLLGEFQTAIRPLGRLFDRLGRFSHSTIPGSGEVRLILDLPRLVHTMLRADVECQSPDGWLLPSQPRQQRREGSPVRAGVRPVHQS